MTHGSGQGSGNALKGIDRRHHHGDGAIAPGTTEPCSQIGSLLDGFFGCRRYRGFQHHMTAWTFLSVKPEIAISGLTQADPFVLAVVAAHLDRQSITGVDLKRLRLPRR